MNKNTYKTGLFYALMCAVLWGVLPIYWDALKPIDSFVIIFYRIVLMMLTCLAICWYQKRSLKAVFQPLFSDKKKLWIYICSGIIITINWSIYIWAVNAGFVIQSSMGYFLEPLLVCVLAMVIYKEKVNKWKAAALILAFAGLLIMVIGYREVPMIALGLASTFAVYAAIKKSVDLPPFQSLLYETLFIAPIALVIVVYLEGTGTGALTAGGTGKFVLLLLAGLATAVPMGFFSAAANKLPLFTLGLTEYISPSLTLVLGIFLFKEPFDMIQFSAFAVIWIGLVFFTYGEICEIKPEHKLEIFKSRNKK